MPEERISMSQSERERLKVLQQIEQGHWRQIEAARRLQLSTRQVRRLQRRVSAEGDVGVIHRLRGRPSNRKIPGKVQRRVLAAVRRRYADFGPTLAAEHLAAGGVPVSRETLRRWMSAAGLWRSRRRRVRAIHVWRERRAAFGELVMMDSSPFPWLEDRRPGLQLIALLDDATSRLWARFAEHDSTAENLGTLRGWLERHGRPLALYTDKNSLFVTSRPVQWQEQLDGQPALTQFGRALRELDIEWIAAHSPQAKGRIERLFRTLQDRLVKEMRLRGIATIEQANHYLESTFLPCWQQRFARLARDPRDAHRRLEREHRLEQILSIREKRLVSPDHTVSWQGQRWGLRRDQVCAGLRGARVEIERRLDGGTWLRFRGRYLPLVHCPAAAPASVSPSGLRPPGLTDKAKTKPKPKYIPSPDHPWRTFLWCRKPDISTLR
jgi:Winged helix-turn helix